MLSYAKLWSLLTKRGMKKTDLLQVISPPTLSKLSKGETVNTSIIEKICAFLKCQPGEIMEYVNDETLVEIARQTDTFIKSIIDPIKEQGISEEQFTKMIETQLKDYLVNVYKGENVAENAMRELTEK